jgi:hypothetical protein
MPGSEISIGISSINKSGNRALDPESSTEEHALLRGMYSLTQPRNVHAKTGSQVVTGGHSIRSEPPCSKVLVGPPPRCHT